MAVSWFKENKTKLNPSKFQGMIVNKSDEINDKKLIKKVQ